MMIFIENLKKHKSRNKNKKRNLGDADENTDDSSHSNSSILNSSSAAILPMAGTTTSSNSKLTVIENPSDLLRGRTSPNLT